MSKKQKKHCLEIELLSPKQVAKQLEITTYLAHDILDRGEIPTEVIDGKLYVREDLLEDLMEDNFEACEIRKTSEVSFWDTWRQLQTYMMAHDDQDGEE